MIRTVMIVFLMASSSIADGDYIFEQSYEHQVYGGYSQSICLDGGNFNGDGQMDFIASYSKDDLGYLYAFLGNGDCTFDPIWSEYLEYPLGSISVNDFNNDGLDDLIIGEGYGSIGSPYPTFRNTIHVLEGKGDGTFAEVGQLSIENVWVTSGDLNDDGTADIVVSSDDYGQSKVLVMLGNGDFTFGDSTSYELPYGDILHTVQILGDMDMDGHVDIGLLGSGAVWFLYGNGDGTFQTPVDVAVHSALCYCFIEAGDFNQDGMPDFAATGSDALSTYDEVFVWDCGEYVVADTIGNTRYWLESSDFDQDGNLDMALGSPCVPGCAIPGNGDGTFACSSDSLLLETTYDETYPVISGDFDLDGDQDLVFCETTIFITCYRNTTISTGCEDHASDVGLDQARLSVGSNPCRGVVTVRIENFSGPSVPGLLVYDLDGHLIRSFSGNGASQGHAEYSFDTSGFPAGVYLLRTSSSDPALVEKLMVVSP